MNFLDLTARTAYLLQAYGSNGVPIKSRSCGRWRWCRAL